MSDPLTERIRTAQADAWQAEGRLREPYGGGAVELPGVRLMASGLPQAKWNNGDVDDAELVDVRVVRAWYAERGVPWGLRVPSGTDWSHGSRLFTKRCMGLAAEDFETVPPPARVEIGRAGPSDLDIVATVDAAAFQEELEASRVWIAPQLDSRAFCCALASLEGEPVGVAVSVATDDRAGPCVGIFGVGVVEPARRRGIGAALTSWLLERAFAAGAELAHLNPETEEAARLYARMGFVETPGFDVYVDV
jgi:GNAT superfamily N-acetyltransferase